MKSHFEDGIGRPFSPQGLFDVCHNVVSCILSCSRLFGRRRPADMIFGCRMEGRSLEGRGALLGEKDIVGGDDGRNKEHESGGNFDQDRKSVV